MASKYTLPLTWTYISVTCILTAFNIYLMLGLLPSNAICDVYKRPWTPVTQGLEETWTVFSNLTFFTKSEYFGQPVRDVDESWEALLPGRSPPRLWICIMALTVNDDSIWKFEFSPHTD